MSTDTLDFPTIEASPIAAPAKPAAAKTSAIADSIVTVQGEVAKFNIIESGLREIEAAHPANVIVGAMNTPAGMKLAEAGWRAYRNPRLEVEKARKAAKAPVLALGKAIDTFAGELESRLRIGEDHYKAQIDTEETRREAEKAEAARIEAERIAKHQNGIQVIRSYLAYCQQPGMTVERISAGIDILAAQTYDAEHWQEFAVLAANAQCETLEAMRVLHAQAVEREAAEVARLEREAEVARQAAENARIAAEQAAQQAELDRQAAEHKANMARIAGHQRRIDEIKAAATLHETQPAATIAEAITAVAALDVGEASYQEMAPLAAAAQAGTLAALWRLHDAAAERERQAAEAVAAFQAQRAADPAPMLPATEDTEGQGSPQVLKATPETADATDRDVPANTSPVVGPMGAGQPSDEGPAGDVVIQGAIHVDPQTGDQFRVSMVVSPMLPEPTLTLGAINERIAPLSIAGAGLAALGFEPAGRRNAAVLFQESDWPAMCDAMVAAITKAKEGFRG